MKTLHSTSLTTRFLLTGLALVGLATTAHAAGKTAPTATEGVYQSGGHPIRFTRFDSQETGLRPVVLLLHGLDGADANRNVYEALATTMTNNGYSVFFIRYFDSFASRPEELAAFQASVKDELFAPNSPKRDRIYRTFTICLETVKDGLRHIRTQPGIDPKQMAVFGLSMGGFLGLAVATDAKSQVKVVVEFFGGLPREFHAKAGQLPPTLILHGDKDRIVPVRAAHELARLLETTKCPHDVCIYPGVDHVFTSEKGEIDWVTGFDGCLRAMTFLEKHLK